MLMSIQAGFLYVYIFFEQHFVNIIYTFMSTHSTNNKTKNIDTWSLRKKFILWFVSCHVAKILLLLYIFLKKKNSKSSVCYYFLSQFPMVFHVCEQVCKHNVTQCELFLYIYSDCS